ncbi:hypothetical protein K493DRAFT_305894 [Basidiobolus meristosporus CBS 931.73]|uniref:Uncharacterized protein n=1 Tax=Basidiobolus meristosporus CBS 931.73 TaxID=1314790 RepID=A0A1Y1XUW0_9FUNG|nr:hypothetical protein K493DRAFT_305894 [Basidiobolus meristosporus CBS 931.73]|eukprot:ORX89276.1 hypothetical protein K493DRAFT_305894 [Basidiobolus meristosporus CBS 931.73]
MKITGYAHICFPSEIVECASGGVEANISGWFYGHFIPETSFGTRKVYGLKGTRAVDPPTIHRCCFSSDQPSLFYDIAMLDYEQSTEETLRNVFRPLGVGDAVELTTDYDDVIFQRRLATEMPHSALHFHTIKLKVGEESHQHVEKYFPNLLKGDSISEDWVVCLGEMSISDFPLLVASPSET